ncbi:MAG: hypothetical protein OEX07_07315, partial [Gammaproteobacteria bacterium]|nr:hypothetical protein [Gammaproteobacteria bacterium]
MTKTRLNIAFLFTLVTAFLMQQWTNSHVHLASEHNHDGTQHKHDIAAHAHKLIDYASSYTINHAVNSHTAANADAI